MRTLTRKRLKYKHRYIHNHKKEPLYKYILIYE